MPTALDDLVRAWIEDAVSETVRQVLTEFTQISPVCFWEDDPVQLDDRDYKGGANRLVCARRNGIFGNAA